MENAYQITLVAAFVPLAFGLYWKHANNQGALVAITLGLSSWILMEIFKGDGVWPPQLVGLLMSITGMLVGSLLPNMTGKHTLPEQEHAYLHHHAASHTEHVADGPHKHK